MSRIDIIIPVCGNLPVVRECLESLYPIPENWNVFIYVSKVSDIDGTTFYLESKKKEFGFHIIDNRENSSHGKAVESLMKKSNSPWILHLDSDAKLLDRKFYAWVEKVIESEKFKVWGRVDQREPMPILEKRAGVRLLRTQSWNILFERRYVTENNLNFFPKKIEGAAQVPGLRDDRMYMWGDTSWEYFWKASKDDVFGRYPDDMWQCWEHKEHSSVDWKKRNIEKIQMMKSSGGNLLAIDEMNPPEKIDLVIENSNVSFLRCNFDNASSSFYYKDSEEKYFLKIVKSVFLQTKLRREMVSLNLLQKYSLYFPKIVDHGENYILMNNCGERISENNVPADAYDQIDAVSKILSEEKIFHMDIKKEELLVKDGNIVLVDFGFSDLNLKSGKGRFPNDDFRLNYLVDKILEKKGDVPRFKYGKENSTMEYKKFCVKGRQQFGASQAQGSVLNTMDDSLSFEGYQSYTIKIKNNKEVFQFSGALKKKINLLDSVKMGRGESILDLGCSNGAAGLWCGYKYNMPEIHLYDHDAECISNLNKVFDWQKNKLPEKNVTLYPQIYSFSSGTPIDRKYDYIITLATIHWFYSATTDIGCLYTIIKKLRDMTNIALIIEWVDLADRTVHHIKKNPQIHKSPYNREVFIESLEMYFSSYRKLGNTTSTRELFVAYT